MVGFFRLTFRLGNSMILPIMTNSREYLLLRRENLVRQLRDMPNLMRGTVVTRQRTCGRKSCACATGGPKHPGLQLCVTLRGKTHTRFVRQADLAEVVRMTKDWERLREIVDDLTEVNLELMRRESTLRPKRRGSRAS